MRRWLLLAIMACWMVGSFVRADTLVLKDGRRLNGDVTESNGRYEVKMRLGRACVSAEQVSQWIKSNSEVAVPETPKATETAAKPDQPATAPSPADTTAPAAEASVDSEGSDLKDNTSARHAVAFAVGPELLITSYKPVQDATSIVLETPDGVTVKAKLVRCDAESGLALLQIQGRKLNYMNVADSFEGGKLQCVTLSVGAFQPTTVVVNGTGGKPAAEWSVRLEDGARLAGAPLVSGGKIVGVALPSKVQDAEPAAVTPERLKAFLGKDADGRGEVVDATTIVFHVIAVR